MAYIYMNKIDSFSFKVRYQQLKNENGVIDAQKLESFECNNDKDIEIF
jgi:hypothetical protein